MLDVKRFWMWESATEGMDVYVLDREKEGTELIMGTIIEVGRKIRIRTIDGKPVSNSKVEYVIIMIEGNQKIKVQKNVPKQRYQILLR